MVDFEKVGVRFDPASQSTWVMQGLRFDRSGCNKNVKWADGYKGEPGSNGNSSCKTGGTSLNEGLTLKVAYNTDGHVDYSNDGIDWINWVGTPIRSIPALERLAFECPIGKVPTAVYFQRAGCNSETNVSTYAWIDKYTSYQYPGCLAGSQPWNDGLSLVAECRPEPSLATGMWKWIDAGFGGNTVNPSDLARVGGLCPAGYAMTGAHFNAGGCGQDGNWKQQNLPGQIRGKCASGQRGPGSTLLSNGLTLRLKCTKYGKDLYECGPLANHNELPCDINAQCVSSSFGGTRCVCNPGYEGTGRNNSCAPINRCDDPDHICAPAPGGVCTFTGPNTYQCSCASGYTGDGKTCRPDVIPSVTNTSSLYPFTARCMLGGRGGKITGTIEFVGLRSTTGDPLGVTVSVKLAGEVDRVVRWDIRSHSVDTSIAENLDACWDAGAIYPGAGKNGLTAKQGQLRANMRFNDPDIKLWGPNNVIGRSIVFEEADGDYIGCCTIHQVGNNQYLPEGPRYAETTSGATCDFDDGRQVTLTQLSASTGSAGNGEEDRQWGHAVGSNVRVNPPLVILSQNFAAAADANVWRTNRGVAPPIARCSTGAYLLGGLTNAAISGYYMDYTFPSGLRPHRQIRLEMTYHALGSWENEWARVEIRQTNPVVNMVIWERKVSTPNGDCAGTANKFNIDVTYTLDRSHQNGVIRVYSSLDGAGGAESFAISNVKITFVPVASAQVVRNKAFSGSSDLSFWSVIATNNVRTPPRVGTCAGYGPLLGGLSVIRSSEVLEYRKPTNLFTRLRVRTRFWFNKNWNGNTAIIEMVRQDGNNPEEVIVMWSRAYSHNPASNINCDGGQFRDFYVDVDATGAFSRSTTTAIIRFKATGTLTAPASFSVGSFLLDALPTETSIDIYQDKFRAGRTPNWFFINSNNARTAVGSDYHYCEGSQSAVNTYYNGGLGSDRVLWGGRTRSIYYTQSGVRPYDKILISFDVYLIGTWDDEQLIVEVDNIGIVWRHKWRHDKVWRSFCRSTGSTLNGMGIHIYESVLIDFPTNVASRTTIGIKFRSTLSNSDLRQESFAVGSLRVTLLPDDQQLRTTTEDNNARITGGIALFSSPGGIVQSFEGNTPENARCEVPELKTPAVAVNGRTADPLKDRWHNLLGYRQGYAESIRYQSDTTSRPFTKAIISFYLWWLDSWNGEWSYSRVKVGAPFDTANPMRYLFKETFHKFEAFFPPFCGHANRDDRNYPDEVRYRSYIHLERSPVDKIEIWWQNTLTGAKTNEAVAISRLSYTTLPEVPLTRIIDWRTGQFSTTAGRAAFKTNGGTALYTNCKQEAAILALGAGSSISYALPAQTAAFHTFRVHFRFWFAGSWDGERATLYATSKEGEWINLWRSDWVFGADLNLDSSRRRFPGQVHCLGGNLGRRNDRYTDHYEDVYVEGSFFSKTTTFNLVWGTTLDQATLDETFAISHVDLQIAPIQSAFVIENANFASTGDSLNGWEAQTELGAWGPPVVTPCGPAGNQDFLVGGRTRLSPLQKMRWTNTVAEVAEPFQVAHIYFRYWFLPTWTTSSLATMQVQETGKTAVDAKWTAPFPFAASQIPNTPTSPMDCSVKRTMFRDIGFTVDFKRNVRSVVITWGIDAGDDRINTPRFAISVFRFDVEQPFPDWFIQGSCVGSTYRPNDGYQITAGGVNWGLGDMSNKHGPLVKDRVFTDNGVLLQGPYSVIGKTIALYKAGTKTSAGCCTIKAKGPILGNPAAPPKQSAGCTWSNKNTEGYLGFIAPSSVRNGLDVVVWARFFGTEATGRHAYTINYNGFGLPEIQNNACTLDLVGQIFGTHTVGSHDFIGPSSTSLKYGNPLFPGTSGPGLTGSSRSRLGDLSGRHGPLEDMEPAATDEIRYTDGQLSFTGPWSIIGRSVVVYSIAGAPIGCCTIGFGPIGTTNSKLDYYDGLGNFSQPLGATEPEAVPFVIPDGEGHIEETEADTFPYWNAGRIALLTMGLVAFIALVAAVAAYAAGGGAGGGIADAGDGYVAM